MHKRAVVQESSCSAARFFLSSEHQLHQQHIAQRTACDTEQGLMLPLVQAHRHQQGDGLRNAAAARKGG